jgi:hypothetical protein
MSYSTVVSAPLSVSATHLISRSPSFCDAIKELIASRECFRAVKIEDVSFAQFLIAWEEEDVLVNVISSPTPDGHDYPFCCEFLKFRGCTMAFCSWYRLLMSQLKHEEDLYDSLSEESVKHVDGWAQRFDYDEMVGSGIRSTRLEHLDVSQLRGTFAPILPMLTSIWYKSVLEGSKLAARMTDDSGNASVLAAFPPFLEALQGVGVQNFSCPHVTRCIARAVGNIMSWKARIPDEHRGGMWRLAERLEQARQTLPSWSHASKELERVGCLAEGEHA